MLRRCVFNLYMQLALKRVDKTVCRTTAHLQYLHSVFNVSEKALAFARETTDPCFYRPDAAGCLEKPDFLPEEPYVISAGAEMRDYATLIEAVKGLPVQLIIGAGSPWAHVRFDAEKRELPPNVQVASFTPLQMRELYRAAEFAVVPVKPTLRACGTNVVLESWAMGKGVIITRTVGQLDYSTDGEDVLFVEPCDVEDMRAKIVHLLRRPAEARRLGQNGLRTVQEQRNLERYVQQLETLFASTLRNEYVAQEPSPAAAQVSGC
jgi:glycosyltransferase involved in cell wall biosynthesis